MKEHLKDSSDSSDAASTAVQCTEERPPDAPIMLYQVLRDEYEALGIFDADDVDEICIYLKERETFHKLIPFEKAEKLPTDERQKQFGIRQLIHSEMLDKVRETLHYVAGRRFNSVYENYKKLIGPGAKDPAASNTAADLATLYELKDDKEKAKPDLKEVRAEAISLVKSKGSTPFELEQKGRELDEIRRREISNSVTALCLSGGGIRSATFCLGVIQGLASLGLLDKLHYLSSVSGGGYIASWLSAWIARTRLQNEKEMIAANVALPQTGGNMFDPDAASQIQEALNFKTANLPEPPEISYLRRYSNYMSPSVGAFSTDMWTLIAVYLRNLLLNWTVIVPLVAAILLVPRLLHSWLNLHPGPIVVDVVAAISVGAGLTAISCINMMRPSLTHYSLFHQVFKTDEIGTIRSTDKVAILCLAPILLFAIGISTIWCWLSDSIKGYPFYYFVAFGAALFLVGYLAGWALMLFNFIRYWSKANRAKRELEYVEPEMHCDDENDTRPKSFFALVNHIYKTYVAEALYSILSGSIGGALLYLLCIKMLPSTAGAIAGIDKANFFVCFGMPIILMLFLLTAAIFTGIAVRITNDDDREWVTRFGALLLKVSVVWTVLSTAIMFGPALFSIPIFGANWDPVLKPAGAVLAGLSGLFSVITGFSSKTPAADNEPAKDRTGFLITIASSVAAPIFILFLIALISFGTEALVLNVSIWKDLNHTFWFMLFAAIGCGMGFFININKFSFHSTYRDRLIRAYLGASNRERMSQANSFTGLDTEADNVEMKDLRHRPLHVVNMTLNMVKSDNLAWQNRKAESFTSTALHSGSSQMGKSGNYRASECYGFNKQNDKAITLGTSAAISGAAVSPNMGYFTQSTAVSFLMVLLNVRLGWWLGNPGQRGNRFTAWKKAAPLWSPLAFMHEAFLQTDDVHPFVYLADGGQFENLGLYEMILRRCKTIIVCDAGADLQPTFFDLGSAIHKIRVDLGVPIEFEPGREPRKGKYGGVATIKYSRVDGADADDGTLIYIKPTLTGTEAIDIQHYHKENPDFPHETTADQFYSETQFESYRSLGFHMLDSLSKGNDIRSIADLVANVRANLTKAEENKVADH